MDDWEEAQFNNRHVHNRVGKSGKNTGAFDVNKILGTYELQCPAANKPNIKDELQKQNPRPSKLELYTLNDKGNALVGELILSGVLSATVLLAGSRKTMSAVIREFEAATNATEEAQKIDGIEAEHQMGDEASGDQPASDANNNEETNGEGDEDEDEDDFAENKRVKEFEKNSFRSPKFWVKWQGQITSPAAEGVNPEQTVTDTGYIIFSGKQSERFQGTISCEPLGWKNIKLSGMKLRSRPARDFDVQWISEPT